MKTIGEKCGWVIPGKERRVLKLLRTHARDRDREFVTRCQASAKAVRIRVQFAEEELSAFQPCVRIVSKSKAFPA
jgi:hypothetical protein